MAHLPRSCSLSTFFFIPKTVSSHSLWCKFLCLKIPQFSNSSRAKSLPDYRLQLSANLSDPKISNFAFLKADSLRLEGGSASAPIHLKNGKTHYKKNIYIIDGQSYQSGSPEIGKYTSQLV
jgi:hypothetical protein